MQEHLNSNSENNSVYNEEELFNKKVLNQFLSQFLV